METPPHQYSQMNQEQNVIPKRKYPVTPTYPIYKRENAIYEWVYFFNIKSRHFFVFFCVFP